MSKPNEHPPSYNPPPSKISSAANMDDFGVSRRIIAQQSARLSMNGTDPRDETLGRQHSSSDPMIPPAPRKAYRLTESDAVSLLDYNEVVYKKTPTSADEEAVLGWFLNNDGDDPFASKTSLEAIKKIMSGLAGSDYLKHDPEVSRRFKYAQKKLVAHSTKTQPIFETPDFVQQGHPKWYSRAACRGSGGERYTFFPERGDSTRSVKDICNNCKVEDVCLSANLNAKYGIWGGTSERGRRSLRKLLINPGVEDNVIIKEIARQRGVQYNEDQQDQVSRMITTLREVVQNVEDDDDS